MEVTLCKSASCPSARCCYRFTAPKSSAKQSEFIDDPRKEDGSCEHFLPMAARGTARSVRQQEAHLASHP